MGDVCRQAWSPVADVVVEQAYPGHARQLAPRLRLADRREIDAVSGREPFDVLLDGVVGSRHAFALMAHGQVEALFGVRGHRHRFGAIWLLGSNWLPKHPKIMVKGMRHFLPILTEDYAVVGNLISEDQEVYRRFLLRFGFQFHEEHEYEEGLLLFTKRNHQHV